MECIDLKQRFGELYQVSIPDGLPKNNPWNFEMPCRQGVIYVHGGPLLGFASDCRGKIANQIAGLPGVQVTQDGDDGINAVFPLELFEHVAEWVKPRRRRRHSAARREASMARLAKHQFSPQYNAVSEG